MVRKCITRSVYPPNSTRNQEVLGDSAAFCERCGVPDVFVTLTANDNWPELKKFLNGVAVETTVLSMQWFRALKPLLWGNKSVFRHITDHWQRRVPE